MEFWNTTYSVVLIVILILVSSPPLDSLLIGAWSPACFPLIGALKNVTHKASYIHNPVTRIKVSHITWSALINFFLSIHVHSIINTEWAVKLSSHISSYPPFVFIHKLDYSLKSDITFVDCAQRRTRGTVHCSNSRRRHPGNTNQYKTFWTNPL